MKKLIQTHFDNFFKLSIVAVFVAILPAFDLVAFANQPTTQAFGTSEFITN